MASQHEAQIALLQSQLAEKEEEAQQIAATASATLRDAQIENERNIEALRKVRVLCERERESTETP